MKIRRVLEYDCFFCDECRKYVYNEIAGEPEQRIPERTRVEELPEDWDCPVCGAPRSSLRASTLVDDFIQPGNQFVTDDAELARPRYNSRTAVRSKHF